MKTEEVLDLVRNHLQDSLPPLARLWLRPGWGNTDQAHAAGRRVLSLMRLQDIEV